MLEELKPVLESGGGAAKVASLSSQYYSLIPTITGRVAPPPIDSIEALGEKEAQLLFWLKMGFEGVGYTPPPLSTAGASKENKAVKECVQLENPIDGLFKLPIPQTLQAAAG